MAVVAYAVPADQTTFDLSTSAKPKKAGTSAAPKPSVLNIGIVGGTNPPGGSPATSTDIVVQLPKTLKWMGAKWPASKRCDAEAAEAAKSPAPPVCPEASRVSLKSSVAPSDPGSGGKIQNHVISTGRHPLAGTKITEPLDLTAYVLKRDPTRPAGEPAIKGGTLGLWLQARPGAPAAVSLMLPAVITKKNTRLAFHIPGNVQEPSPGLPTGIERLAMTIDGKVTRRVKGKRKTYGAISSVGCKDKRWKVSVNNIYRDGEKTRSDTSSCSAKKKKKRNK